MSDKERRMDFDRNHRSGGNTSNELFLCFTSRPSSNSTLMKIPSSKSIRSPNHHKNEKSREPTLSISSSRRIIRRNGSIKSGQFSPMMFPATGSSKKRGCSFETPEPSSPKVTCIGQVRVKTKKQGKKILAKRRRNPKVSFRKSDHTQDEILKDNQQQQQNHQHSCLPYRNQKWVHFPFTICEALRSFGSDLNCFLPCGRSPCSPSMGKREKEEKWGKEANRTSTTTTTTSCAPILARWLMTLQDQDLEEEEEEKRDRMDMVFEVEEDEVERENLMVMGEEEDEKRVSICLPPKNALLLMRCRSDPSKLASLASRYCDSPEATKEDGDYSDEEHDEEDEDEEGMETELEEEQKLAEELTDKWSIDENQENHEFEENQEEEQLQQEEEEDARRNGGVEEKGLDQNEEVMANESLIEIGKNQTPQEGTILQEVEEDVNCDIEVLNPPKTEEEFMLEVQEEFEEVLGLNIVSEETPKILVLDEEPILKTLLDEDQELFENSRIKNPEPMLEEEEEVLVEVQEVEDMEHQELQEPKLDKVEEDHKIGEVTENQELEEEFMLLVVEEEKEEKEQEVVEKIEGMNDLSCIEKEPNLQEEEIGVEETERISIAPSGKLDREDSELAIARAQEEKEEEEEEELGLELEEGVEKLVMEEKEKTQNKVGIIVIDTEKENINENEGCEEEGEESSKPEEKEIESKKVVLPDSMMWMMMCEPKLSMEVSKETWLCNGNFISSSWPYYDDNSRPPQLILNNKAAIDVQNQRRKHHHYQQQQRQRRPLSSSCSLNPGRKVVLSMASMIEQKLVKTMAYEPLVLMRCKSEPIRSSIKLAPES